MRMWVPAGVEENGRERVATKARGIYVGIASVSADSEANGLVNDDIAVNGLASADSGMNGLVSVDLTQSWHQSRDWACGSATFDILVDRHSDSVAEIATNGMFDGYAAVLDGLVLTSYFL